MKTYWHSGLLFLVLTSLSAVLYKSNTQALILSIIWTTIIVILNFLINKTGRISFYRTIFFVILAVSFFLETRLFTDFNDKTETLPLFCHVGMAGNSLHILYNQLLSIIHSNWDRFGALSIGILWLLIILCNGQAFCGWVCFFGGIDDGLSQILKKPVIKLAPSKKFREFQFAVLIFFAFISFLYVQPIFCLWICPLKITSKIINPNSPAILFQTGLYITVGAVFLIALPVMTKKRIFCGIICPFGAIPPLIDKIVPYKVTIDNSRCTSCLKCVDSCPSFAIEKIEDTIKINKYCVFCGRCMSACDDQLITFTLFHKKSSNLIPLISMLIGGVISLFFVPKALFHIIRGIF